MQKIVHIYLVTRKVEVVLKATSSRHTASLVKVGGGSSSAIAFSGT